MNTIAQRREIYINNQVRAVSIEQKNIQQQLAQTITTATERLLAFSWMPVGGIWTHHWLEQLTELKPAQLFLCQYNRLLFELQVKKLHSLLPAYFAFNNLAAVVAANEIVRRIERDKAGKLMENVRALDQQYEIAETVHQFAQPLVNQ